MKASRAPIYFTKQIREFESEAEKYHNLPSSVLMERAGAAALDYLIHRWPEAVKISLFCGRGNNAGDGYVLARLAHEHGKEVTIWQVGDLDEKKVDAVAAREACIKADIDIQPFRPWTPEADLANPHLIVDAICGIGLTRPISEDLLAAIQQMQCCKVPILSLDIPTGIQADTGAVLGSAVHATATITFIGLKMGLLTGMGVTYTGDLVMNTLGLPDALFETIDPVAELISVNDFAAFLQPRARDWHKGLSGHVVIIGGDYHYFGAPQMAGLAALRVGAGLVTILTRKENAALISANSPVLMTVGVEDDDDISSYLAKASVVVIGPGLGQSAWSKALLKQVINHAVPLVIDADGLNLLAKKPHKNSDWVLTPHPGEAARLLGCSTKEIQKGRLAAIKKLQKKYAGVCVLKGAGSLVLGPTSLPGLCDKGNPGMATAGTGDILSGVIGGLLAQGLLLEDAARLGVCLHAAAGDLAAKEGERGMIATDLLPFLHQLSNISSQI